MAYFSWFQWLLRENWVHWDPCSLEVCLYHEGSTEVVLNVLRSGQPELGIKQTLLWAILIDVQSEDSGPKWQSGQSFSVSIFWSPLNQVCRLQLLIFFQGHADDIINEIMNTKDEWLLWAAIWISSLPPGFVCLVICVPLSYLLEAFVAYSNIYFLTLKHISPINFAFLHSFGEYGKWRTLNHKLLSFPSLMPVDQFWML